MFKNPGHYFLSISFEWKDIFRLLEVPEEERGNFEIEEKYRYQSPNPNSDYEEGINSTRALFEYYILSNVLRNGSYSFSAIFDQQLKRFFETPNINYGQILKNSKKEDSTISCFFEKGMLGPPASFAKAGFSIGFSQDYRKWKIIVFMFDEKFLNLTDAHNQWGKQIPFEVYKISHEGKGDSIVKKVSVDPKVFWLTTNVQSQYDAGAGPFYRDLRNFFKK